MDIMHRCEVCGSPWADRHHVKHQGSGGTYATKNIIHLCREHHNEIHAAARNDYIDRYGDFGGRLQRLT